VLPFVTPNPKHPLDAMPLTWWNDTPGIDHKLDFKRGVTYANMLIEAIAADECGHHPIESIFASIIEDAVARKIKGGPCRHRKTCPPVVANYRVGVSSPRGIKRRASKNFAHPGLFP
jgi:hypothetical protein